LLLALLLFGGDFTNSIGMKFVEIPSGSYMMGTATPSTADCPKDNPFTHQNEHQECVDKRIGDISQEETPQHRVHVKSFYMATTEVTQGQWYAVMGNNPAKHQNGNPDMPVENVSWYDAQKFVKKLNQMEHTDKYRLPTEEEWEYAARAGSTGKWCFGDDERKLRRYAWYDDNSGNHTHPVATKKPNSWGLYDMHGNVWEWTGSWYSYNYNSPREHENKVLRGGCYGISAIYSRSADRSYSSRGFTNSGNGFRLSRTK
jgi:formylglycine-generating enzyme required for sulfatase activity